ncbi:MAG: carbohydrate-binding family 9-like protein [Gemmatimonadota bacterium]
MPWAPRRYDAYRADGPIRVDGRLDDDAWGRAPWTDDFVDISGDPRAAPPLRTRAKILWDDEMLWIAAEIEEPHVWGTLRERDAVIYMDDDFELFIDPDGDSHQYYELEINALGTIWDLFLVRPYRDGGPAVHAWDVPGLRSAVHVAGTVNDPSDEDEGWSVEIGIPWPALAEATDAAAPPGPDDRWRINFSRVDWPVEVRDGAYLKRRAPETGAEMGEANWTWSPQGLVAMHYPEMWGVVRFVAAPAGTDATRGADFPLTAAERAAWELRRVYYAEREHRARAGRFTADPDALDLVPPEDPSLPWPPRITASEDQFEARLLREDGSVLARIDHEGRVRPGP